MSEINEAVQILEVSIKAGEDIVKVGTKIGNLSAKMMKLLFGTIQKFVMQEYRSSGKVRAETIRRLGQEMQCFRFPEADLPKVEEQLKARKVMYAVLPDLNSGDGKKEIMFSASATARVNSMIEALGFGEVIGFGEYEKNAEPGALDREIKNLKNDLDNLKEEEDISKKKDDRDGPGADRSNVKDFEKNAEYAYQSNRSENKEITINKKLVIDETETHYITRIPYTQNYVLITKDQTYWLNDQTLSTFLERDKKYPVCDQNGKEFRRVSGQELVKNYDIKGRGKEEKTASKSKTKEPRKKKVAK